MTNLGPFAAVLAGLLSVVVPLAVADFALRWLHSLGSDRDDL